MLRHADTSLRAAPREAGRETDRALVAMSRSRFPRLAAVALVVCVTLSPSRSSFANAQMDLAPTIQAAAQWPCAEEVFEECAVPYPPGGLTPAEWYTATRWDKASYTEQVDSTGEPTGTVGETSHVGTAFTLYEALENRDVSTIVITNGFTLPDLKSWRWPDEGYPVRRDVSIITDPECVNKRARDEETEEDLIEAAGDGSNALNVSSLDTSSTQTGPGSCIIDCKKKTFLVLTEVGGVTMTGGLTLKNGGGRLGGFINIRPGAAASFDDVVFERGAFQHLSDRITKHPVTPKPGVQGVTVNGVTQAYGGAVCIVNDDRLRTEEELAAARAAVAGTTAADSVTLGVPHNITFVRCTFLSNSALNGDGGAVYARTSGLGYIIFDDCLFQSNRADTGVGGAVAAVGGRVIFHETNFDGNVAGDGGALSLRRGGLVGGSAFSNNVATSGSGGGVFAAGAENNPTASTKITPDVQQPGWIQNSFFRGNRGKISGGAVFSVGGWRFWNNEYDLIANGVDAEGVVAHPNVYACTVESGGDTCLAYTSETEFAQTPAYAPFAEQNLPQVVYVRPNVVEVTVAVEVNEISGVVRPAGADDIGSDSTDGASGDTGLSGSTDSTSTETPSTHTSDGMYG